MVILVAYLIGFFLAFGYSVARDPEGVPNFKEHFGMAFFSWFSLGLYLGDSLDELEDAIREVLTSR